jgi:hypothetical protein
MANAYWIGPRGQIIDVPMRHIGNVISDPKKFGLDKPFISKIYRKYHEPMGREGKAREEIMILLMKNGWIRVRKGMNEWVVQVWNLTDARKNYIWDFIVTGMKKGQLHKYSQVTVQDIRDHHVVSSSVDELVKSLFERKKTKKIKIKELLPKTLGN